MSHITPYTRCVGTRDARYVESVCPVRETCERYLALLAPRGVMVVDARAYLCTPGQFEHRIEATRIAAPHCGQTDSGKSVRESTEQA